jgi:hypothetical protein
VDNTNIIEKAIEGPDQQAHTTSYYHQATPRQVKDL